MKVLKIDTIIGCRTFRNFMWPSNLPEFEDFNLIYGWNGTGKTTIADILRAIERKHNCFEGQFSVQTDTSTITSDKLEKDWGDQIPPIRVFNHTYVEENIFATSNVIMPIFFLGEQSVEKQKKLEEKLKLRHEKNDEYRIKIKEKESKEKDLDSLCVRVARTVKESLMSSGTNPYNNYDKRGFKNKIEQMLQNNAQTSYIKTDEQKLELKAKFSGSQKLSLDISNFQFPDIAGLYASTATLLNKSILSDTITALQKDEKLSAWVKQGLDIHIDGHHQDCQFCLQPLPLTRIKTLEKHFSNEYTLIIDSINSTIMQIDLAIKNIDEFRFKNKSEIYDYLVTNFSEAETNLNTKFNEYKNLLDNLKNNLERKRVNPFQNIEMNISLPSDGAPELNLYFEVLKKHNTNSENHTKAVQDARTKYEEAILVENLSEYNNFKKDIKNAEDAITKLQEKIDILIKEIESLEISIKEHRKPAEEINKDLISYLGHEELKFTVEENGYVINRSEIPARDLSEGEKTAIALIYFLKTLEDKNFIPKGIVVIDDPISSLDDSALFQAFSYIKEKTKDAKQIFILTHNFMFFRQVKNWFKHTSKRNNLQKKAKYYQTFCTLELGSRQSNICEVDKLLIEYESEYHYLFKQVYIASLAKGNNLSEFYAMPNIARRVLEYFLSFRKPSHTGDGRLHKMLESTNFDPVKKTKILRFVNVHSHEDLGAPEHDPSVLVETPQVMRDLLDLIESEDTGHYNEMINVFKK